MAADEIDGFHRRRLRALQIDDVKLWAISASGRHDGDMGNGKIGHRLLHAGQGAAAGHGLHRGRAHGTRFAPGDARDDLTAGDAGQPVGLLGFRAGQHQRFGGEQGGDKRHMGEAATGGFSQLGHFLDREAKAAMGFRHACGGPAQFGNLFPQGGVHRRCVSGHRLARRAGAGLFGEQLARLFAEFLGFVGKIEIHGSTPQR